MNIQPISQRDPRWSKKRLGFSSLTIGTHGCTLTALTMLLNYSGYSVTPDQVNDALKILGEYSPKNTKGAFLGAYLVWANVPRIFTKLKFKKRGWNYNNAEVAWYVYVKRTPIMVEVNATSIGAPKHWVLFIGGQRMCDPWTGKVEKTSKYPLTGYAVFERK